MAGRAVAACHLDQAGGRCRAEWELRRRAARGERAAALDGIALRRLQQRGSTAALRFGPRIGQRHRSQQQLRVGMARRRVERAGRSGLDELAAIHHGDPVRDVPDHRQVVRDEEVGEAELGLEVLQQVDDLGLDRDVERRYRLVGDDQVGPHDQGAGDADALALATREFARVARQSGRRQAAGVERLADQPIGLGAAGDGEVAQRLGKGVAHRHARVERRIGVLEDHLGMAPQCLAGGTAQRADVTAADFDLAARRRQQADHDAAERRFAGPRFAHQPERLAGRDLEADIVHRRGLAEQPGDVPYLHERRRHNAGLTQQRTPSSSGGSSVAQRGSHHRQRGWNLQPAG